MAFIKLDRDLFESKFWLSEPFSKPQAWVDLIAMANFADKTKYYRGSFHKIKRGQVVTSQRTLAERWKWSKSKVSTFIQTLVDAEMVTTDQSNRWTVLTIVNYAKYQDPKTTKRPQTSPQEGHEETTERPRKGLQEEYKNKEIPLRVYIPTRADLRAYVEEKDLKVDPDEIFDYYEALGWEINGKAIKDWKAVCRRWKKYDRPRAVGADEDEDAELHRLLDMMERGENIYDTN